MKKKPLRLCVQHCTRLVGGVKKHRFLLGSCPPAAGLSLVAGFAQWEVAGRPPLLFIVFVCCPKELFPACIRQLAQLGISPGLDPDPELLVIRNIRIQKGKEQHRLYILPHPKTGVPRLVHTGLEYSC